MNGRDIMFLVAAVVLTNLPALLFSSTAPYSTWAQEIPEDTHVTTERFCSFGMAKGEKQQKCEVPILPGWNRPSWMNSIARCASMSWAAPPTD